MGIFVGSSKDKDVWLTLLPKTGCFFWRSIFFLFNSTYGLVLFTSTSYNQGQIEPSVGAPDGRWLLVTAMATALAMMVAGLHFWLPASEDLNRQELPQYWYIYATGPPFSIVRFYLSISFIFQLLGLFPSPFLSSLLIGSTACIQTFLWNNKLISHNFTGLAPLVVLSYNHNPSHLRSR